MTAPTLARQIKVGPLVLEPSPRWIRAKVEDVTVLTASVSFCFGKKARSFPSTSSRATTCVRTCYGRVSILCLKTTTS